jgi:hypothetical protein
VTGDHSDRSAEVASATEMDVEGAGYGNSKYRDWKRSQLQATEPKLRLPPQHTPKPVPLLLSNVRLSSIILTWTRSILVVH